MRHSPREHETFQEPRQMNLRTKNVRIGRWNVPNAPKCPDHDHTNVFRSGANVLRNRANDLPLGENARRGGAIVSRHRPDGAMLGVMGAPGSAGVPPVLTALGWKKLFAQGLYIAPP